MPFFRTTRLGLLCGVVLGAAGCRPAAPQDRLSRVESLASGYQAQWPGVPQVTADALRAEAEPPLLIDARTDEERRVSVIPGAVGPDELPAQTTRPVLVYCTIGYRSTRLAAELRRRGHDAQNLHGGVLAWAHGGGAFVTPDGHPTRQVHVYGKDWDLLPATHRARY